MSKDDNIKDWRPLYRVVENLIPKDILRSKNRTKSWKYGYDSEHDIVIISRDGTLGQIYEIEGLFVGLPRAPKEVEDNDNKWKPHEVPEELTRIKTVAVWKKMPDDFKRKYVPYIEREFDRRDQGHWFKNKNQKTYITGKHYMYLQHSQIDVGLPDFREANRILFIYWQACIADPRCFGMIYLKIRRSGFSFMSSADIVEEITRSHKARGGILSKTGSDAKKMFTDKVVPISRNYPFFFKPVQSGMDRPKTELMYSVPATKITKRNMNDKEDDEKGLDSSIDWKNTDSNSYDGEKLIRLSHDESGKWEKPESIEKNWGVTRTCLQLGRKIIGKCMMGSTCNALNKGGQEFKDLYYDSLPTERSKNGRTKSGLYKLFIPMEHNYEGYMDEYGHPVFETPKKPVMGLDGELIDTGVIEFWKNEEESLKSNPDKLNEFYRQFPRTENHAFRDESKSSIFNLTKIYDQIDYNDGVMQDRLVTRGRFTWRNGDKGGEVLWVPDPNGRFYTSWHPSKGMANNVERRDGRFYPGNKDLGAFGCDSYDISGTVSGPGSKAALSGLTSFNMMGIPCNMFFLEYIARPSTTEEFFEDVIMAIHYYGMPILAENNKPRLLYELKNRGYRPFSINRPDKPLEKLSKFEKEVGGIPNSSEDIRQAHASSIETYIEKYVGYDTQGHYRSSDEMGNMYFNRTLNDWAKFEYNNRTKYDASISSGLAIMATQKHKYTPERKKSKITLKFATYDNSGTQSTFNE